MKIVRIQTDDIFYGVVEEDGIGVYEGSPFVAWEPTDVVIPFSRAQLLAPVLPTKIVAVARNYAAHAAELGKDVPPRPRIFMKPATTVVGPGASVVYPEDTGELHHEAELAVIMGRVAHHVAAEDASDYILGYTAANDMTARDIQRLDGLYTIAKGFDTFCPLGPAIETELDPREGLSVVCRVNGDVRQDGSTADMLFGVDELVAFITRVMTMLPGDIILTGTPAGVGSVEPGDRMEVEVDGVGTLINKVVTRE